MDPIEDKSEKTKLKRFLIYFFPRGNYRYYVAYISSLIVLGVSAYVILAMINFLDCGMVIHTDTFTASMPFSTSHRLTVEVIGVITGFYNLFGVVWCIFAGFTGLSILADLVYLGVSIYRRLFPQNEA
jgi:hypothetical protein